MLNLHSIRVNPVVLALEELRSGEILLREGSTRIGLYHYRRAAALLRLILLQKKGPNSKERKDREKKDSAKKDITKSSFRVDEVAAHALIDFPEAPSWLREFHQACLQQNIKKAERTKSRLLRLLLYMSRTQSRLQLSHQATRTSVLSWCAVVAIVCTSLAFYGRVFSLAFHAQEPIKVENQVHYAEFANNKKDVLLWVEFGKDGQLVSGVPESGGYQVNVSGLNIGGSWNFQHPGAVNWNIQTGWEGDIFVSFPQDLAANHLALSLFLTDKDFPIRTAHLTSGDEIIVADNLVGGRWFTFFVSETEKKAGFKTIKIRSLTGGGAAVSALVLHKIG